MPGASTLGAEIEALFDRPPDEGVSLALVVQQHGEIVAERYGVRPGNLFEPGELRSPPTPRSSRGASPSRSPTPRSACSSADGAARPARSGTRARVAGTEKAAITVLDLVEMRSGLAFVEDYVDGESSDVIDMLFGAGAADHAAFAAAKPLRTRRARVELLVGHDEHREPHHRRRRGRRTADRPSGRRRRAFLDQRLFGPIGMTDADARFDDAGTLVGSSYVYARRDSSPASASCTCGTAWSAASVLPPGAGSTTPAPVVAHDPETGFDYGAPLVDVARSPRPLAAHGYEGQYVIVLPAHDAVVVHLGKTDAAVRDRLVARLRRIVPRWIPAGRRSGGGAASKVDVVSEERREAAEDRRADGDG